jgi:SAM-dependent MidA family methyltransferase
MDFVLDVNAKTQVSGSSKQIAAIAQSKLAKLLAEKIRQVGKITFREWMADALYHPIYGYYNRTDLKRWGKAGDYRTSPERSELFAATFARYFASLYELLGRPAEFVIVEMGAGNGRFAAGVLDTFETNFPDVFSATQYVVIEASAASRQRAAEELERYVSRVRFVELHDLQPVQRGIFFSNELLDAFPVHRITLIEGELKELFVSVTGDAKFIPVFDNPSSHEILEFYLKHIAPLAEGQIVEVNTGIGDWFQTIEDKLTSGYLITVDYGAEAQELYSSTERQHGTLRAFRRHEFVDDVLLNPGECDITSSVDWTYVESEGKRHGFEVVDFARLDRFLMQSGVFEELERRLDSTVSEAEKTRLTTSSREMILPNGMASSFQVLIQKR